MTKTMIFLITIFSMVLCANIYVQAQTIKTIDVLTEDIPVTKDSLKGTAVDLQYKIIGQKKEVSDCTEHIASLLPQIEEENKRYDHLQLIINSNSYSTEDNP